MRDSGSIDRFSTFFEGVARTRGLRAALVIDGGKSSASLDRIIERELDAEVAVLRVRLQPNLSLTLPASMTGSSCCRLVDELAMTDPASALCMLAAALRRVTRAHSILLVVDELHTLDHSMQVAFALFLASLADEMLSILCVSRVSGRSIRGTIERYLIDEIRLDRLDCEEDLPVRSGGVIHLPRNAGDRSPASKATSAAALARGSDWYRTAVESLDSMPVAFDLPPGPETPHGRDCGRLRISVVGEFAAHLPDGTTIPIRGQRLRTVLGVLVIDRMLATPLSSREFCRLAAGDADEPARAQKIMIMGIKRLQEVLGEGAIDRSGETPKLNLDIATVDLLQAHELLGNARIARQQGPLTRAVDHLVAALEIVQGKDLFPGLEGGMYAAAREELAGNLRSSIVDVVRQLWEEGEIGVLESVLRRATEALPDDDQLIELRHQVVASA